MADRTFSTELTREFEILRPLDEGESPSVYLARHLELDRTVAIKLLPARAGSTESHRQSLAREAEVLVRLKHPNVVGFFDYRVHGDEPFLVLEAVDGGSLKRRLMRRAMTGREALEVGLQIARALVAVHEEKFAHGNLKPENIVLDGEGRVRLVDFGMAEPLDPARSAAADTGRSRPESVQGSPLYLAPERFRGVGATESADLYALGVLLYECLAGRPPFSARRLEDLDRLHQTAPIPPLWSAGANFPKPMETVIERLLAKDPRERPGSAREVLVELEDLVLFAQGWSRMESAGAGPAPVPGLSGMFPAVDEAALHEAAASPAPAVAAAAGSNDASLHEAATFEELAAAGSIRRMLVAGLLVPLLWVAMTGWQPGPAGAPGWSSAAGSGSGRGTVRVDWIPRRKAASLRLQAEELIPGGETGRRVMGAVARDLYLAEGNAGRVVDMTTGRARATIDLGQPIHAVHPRQDLVVWIGRAGRVLITRRSDGSTLTRLDAGGPPAGQASVGPDRIYVARRDGVLIEISLSGEPGITGDWKLPVPPELGLERSGDLLYLASGKQVVAWSLTKMAVAWTHPAREAVRCGPLLHGDQLFAGLQDGTLVALDPASGEEDRHRLRPFLGPIRALVPVDQDLVVLGPKSLERIRTPALEVAWRQLIEHGEELAIFGTQIALRRPPVVELRSIEDGQIGWRVRAGQGVAQMMPSASGLVVLDDSGKVVLIW